MTDRRDGPFVSSRRTIRVGHVKNVEASRTLCHCQRIITRHHETQTQTRHPLRSSACLGTAKRAATGETLNKIYAVVSSATRFTRQQIYITYNTLCADANRFMSLYINQAFHVY